MQTGVKSKQAVGAKRKAVVQTVLKAAKGREQELCSASWTPAVVNERLKNCVRQFNKRTRTADGFLSHGEDGGDGEKGEESEEGEDQAAPASITASAFLALSEAPCAVAHEVDAFVGEHVELAFASPPLPARKLKFSASGKRVTWCANK